MNSLDNKKDNNINVLDLLMYLLSEVALVFVVAHLVWWIGFG